MSQQPLELIRASHSHLDRSQGLVFFAWLDDHAAREPAAWEARGGAPGGLGLAREGARLRVEPGEAADMTDDPSGPAVTASVAIR